MCCVMELTGSVSGLTARLLSKYRPVCPIIMVTRSEAAARVSFLNHESILLPH